MGAWSTCTGCGVSLPGSGESDPRRNASPECWQLYGEVIGYEATHLALLGRYHQMTVDAYGAQHGARAGPRIGTAFGLIGLRLALVDGWTGSQVRDAHRYMAERSTDWPAFVRTRPADELTVYDVALAGSPEAHATLVQAWAASVWSGWQAAHDRVAALIEERLPAEVRVRLTAG